MSESFSGHIRKLHSRLEDLVAYSLPLAGLDMQRIALNPLLGKKICLQFSGNISCVYCGRKTSKSFNQGYCYPCFQSLAQCDSCIISPEKCHYDAGTCREPVWADEFCMQDHIVYLANSSGIKVGITRASQIPDRWVDQGAVQALPVFRVRTRQQSGFLELLFKQHISDKTNWRAMLRDETDHIDLPAERDRLLAECQEDIRALQDRFGIHAISLINGAKPRAITYPVVNYPQKIVTLGFDKNPLLEGVLLGIKGQYLILDTGVLNIRKFTAYEINFSHE